MSSLKLHLIKLYIFDFRHSSVGLCISRLLFKNQELKLGYYKKLMVVAGCGGGMKMGGGRVITEWKDILMELLLRIVSLVDDRSVIVASGVCSGWRDAICRGLTRLSLSWLMQPAPAGEYASTAYVSFRYAHALETAVFLGGASILDQPVCITNWGQSEDEFNIWNRSSWKLEDESSETHVSEGNRSVPSAGEAVSLAQDVVKSMVPWAGPKRKKSKVKDKLKRTRVVMKRTRVVMKKAM
ncbi:hypothetical protein POM88_020754 [Heracleum sosnowskyi]|uniref:F-box protein n=1 Tax=Heracleum sosnowskyi TaxID=360622 RepID=A0AAD8IC51_9APIA|nr:hypothetical protein POM88_020754 [Heracleum sosnowskyi]